MHVYWQAWLKIRLILETPQAPDESDSKGWGIKKLLVPTLIFVGIFGFAFVSVAEAGLFSFVDKFFGSNISENDFEVDVPLNSQTALLLKSIFNPDPVAGYGGGGMSGTIENQSALLPDTGLLGSIADIEEGTANSDRISIYVVREGDSLSQIAKMFGVSVSTIIWANDIKWGNLIRIDQVLVILPVTGVQYIIKTGDTIESIAKKYKSDVGEIIQFNNLSLDNGLTVGDEIIIPDGEGGAIYRPTSSYTSARVRGTGEPNYAGYYSRPIKGGVRSQGLHGYNAIDLATYCGAPIFAAASGDVIVARSYGWNGGYGKYIVITHSNGTQTLYSHLSELIVTVGWHVVQGQVIGYIGTTGRSTGCHVHFEVRGAKNPF